MDYQERTTVQSQFIHNDIKIIVATSAFGMGINKQDVRTVIHYHLSTSPSKYVQEVGELDEMVDHLKQSVYIQIEI